MCGGGAALFARFLPVGGGVPAGASSLIFVGIIYFVFVGRRLSMLCPLPSLNRVRAFRRHCCFYYCCCPSVSPSTSADVKASNEFDQQQQSDCQQSDQQQQQQRSSASRTDVFASIRLQNDQWRTSKSLIGSSHVVVVHRLRCFLRFLIATLCVLGTSTSSVHNGPRRIAPALFDEVGIQLQFRRWAMVIGSRNVSSQYEQLHWNTELFRVPPDAVRVRLKCEALLATYEFEPLEHRLEVQWKRFAEDGDVSAEETDQFDWMETAILEVETTAEISASKLESIKWRCLARVPLPAAGGDAAVAISRPLTFARSENARNDIDHEEANDGNALGEKEKTEREEREAEEFVLILRKIQGDSTNLLCSTNRSLAEHPKNVQWWLNGQQMPIGPRTQLKPGSNLSGLQLSLSFLDPSDQGFYDCSVGRSDGPLWVERVQHILLIVQRTTAARLEQVQVELEHRPERCFRLHFLQPKGTRMNNAYRQKYFLTFYRLHEPMQKVIGKDVDQGERNMSLPDNEEFEQYFGDPSLLHQSEQINSYAFRLMPRACEVVPDQTDGNGTSGEGRVRCEFRCCQSDTCGAQFDTGAVKYALQAAAIIGAGAITALSQPPTIVSTWDDFAPKALPLDFLFNRQSSQLWIRWHAPDPSQIRGLVERYHLEVEFEQNKRRLQRIERRLPAFDTESHLNISGGSFAVRVRVVPETRSGLPQEELMMASPHQYPHFIFTDWMEQHLPEGTISSDASMPVPVVLFRQPSNGQSGLTVTWDGPSAEQIRWMLIRAIRLRSTEAIGEGIWRLNASDVSIELDHTNFELGFVYQLCATFVSEQPQRAHGPWRCQAVPFFDANGQLKAADELTSEASSLKLKSVEEDEQYGKSNGVERAAVAAAHLLLPKSDEDAYEHLPEPIHCKRAHCRCAFIAPTVPSEKMAMTISWEPVDGPSSSSTGFKMGESRMVAVHYTLDMTDDPTATWMSPFLAVHIPSDAPTRRQIQFEIEDDLQLLPDTTYRFMLEAHQKERRKDLPSLEGTYFDCHIPADLDLPPPTNFRLAPFTTGGGGRGAHFFWRPPQLPENRTEFSGKRIDGFELHFQRVDRANILLDGWQADGEGTTRRQSDFHRTIQGAQVDNFLLDEPLSNTYQVWLCTHWTDANLTSPYSSSSSFATAASLLSSCSSRLSLPLVFHSAAPSLPSSPPVPVADADDEHRIPSIPLAAAPPLSDDHPSPSIQQRLPLYKHPIYPLVVVGLIVLFLFILLSTAVLWLWMQRDRSWIWRQLKRNRRRRGREPSIEKGTEMNPIDCPNGSSIAKHIPQHLQNGLHKMLALRLRESDALLDEINAENVQEPNGEPRHLRSVSMHFEHSMGSNACGVGVGPAERRVFDEPLHHQQPVQQTVVVQVENVVEDEWHRQADAASNSHFTHSLSTLHQLFSPVTVPKTQHRRRVSAPFIVSSKMTISRSLPNLFQLLLAQQSHSPAVFKMVNDDSGIAITQHDDELEGGEEEVSRTSVCTSSDDAAHEEERTMTEARVAGLNCRKRSSVVTDEANSSNDSSSLHFDDGELEVKREGKEKPMSNYPYDRPISGNISQITLRQNVSNDKNEHHMQHTHFFRNGKPYLPLQQIIFQQH